MFSWKERLYAILLRRVLGPLLSPHSLPKLHSCVSQVSIADGTYTLTNVELNADYLTTRLEQQQQQGGSSNANHHHQQQQTTLGLLRFVSVVVGKLHVEIRLVEQQPEVEPGDAPNSSKETSNGSSSLAWRAFQLGNGTSSSSSVALVVRVRLEDVVVTVEAAAANVVPLAATTQTEEIDTPQPPSITPVQSFLSSYIEAALSSLRLSIELVRARVRIQETTDPPNETTTQQQQQQQAPSSSSSDLYTAMRPRHQKWLEIRIQSASYRDNSNDINGGSMTNNASAVANNQNQNTSATLAGSSTCGNESSSSSFTYETVLYKVLEVTRITLVTGHCTSSEPSSSASSIVSLLEGTSRCSLRLNQYPLDPNDPMTKEPKQQYRQQHDIQLILNQKLNVSLDVTTLQHIISIAKSCKSRPMGANEANCPVDAHGTFDGNTTPVPRSLFLADGSTTTTTTDEADYDAIRGIMQQYEEARKLVERREMRGGMLVPTVDSGGGVTFDTFFDANEHAFGRYSSGMMDSIVVDTRNDSSAEKSTNTIGNNHVNTKVIFHLQEGGVKIAFLPSRDSGDSTPNEYILLTFNDVNLSSQISRQSTKHAFTIGHLELEDSYRKTGPHCDTRKQCASFTNEISTLLLFSPFLNGDDDDDEEDDPILLVRPPCVALTVETFISNDQDSLVAELNLLPMEISYRSHLVAHVADLVSQLQSVVTENGLSDELSDMHTVILSESKPRVRSINVTCSSLVVSMPVVTEQDWDVLYSRSGYVSQGALTKTSSLGLLFECLEAELVQKIDESSSFSISSHNIVYYANSPKGAGNVFDQTSDRFDMFALCGLNEIDPCIPVELRITQCGLGNSSETANISAGLAVENFPVVPLLSSFKTRQDDDETEVARGTKICDKNKSKNQLRASDEQDSMLAKVKKSEVVVSVNIPEFVVDVSRKELMLLRDILDSLRPESTDKRNAQPKDQLQVPKIVSFTINCDDISLAVHSERDESFSDQYTDGSDSAQFSFLVKMDRLRSHLLFEGTAMRHSRLLMQEVDAFESTYYDDDDMFS